jgi:hypothetical protein
MAAVREEPQDALGVFAVFRRSGRREYCGGVVLSRSVLPSLESGLGSSCEYPAAFKRLGRTRRRTGETRLANSCCRDLFEEDRVSSVDDQPADENA